MPRKPRTTSGVVTQVSPRLRIRNGDVDSLRRLRSVGRPKKTENIVTVCRPEFAGKIELADLSVRNGFQYVRSAKRETRITELSVRLQAKFDRLCSEVRIPNQL